MAAMLAVTIVTVTSGLGLTFLNRKGAERVVFEQYGYLVLQGVAITLWMSPFLPEALRDCRPFDIGLGLLNMASSAYALQQLYGAKAEVMAGRNKKKGTFTEAYVGESLVQDAAYFFPNLPGCFATFLSGMVEVNGGRGWIDQISAAHPEYLGITFNIILLATLAGHIGSFAVTLRDKGLISQEAEMIIAGGSNVLSLVYVALLLVQYPWFMHDALLVLPYI